MKPEPEDDAPAMERDLYQEWSDDQLMDEPLEHCYANRLASRSGAWFNPQPEKAPDED